MLAKDITVHCGSRSHATDEAHVYQPALITEIKQATVKSHGLDATKTNVDIICYKLALVGRWDKFKDNRLCLVDCRYVVNTLYGYSLMRPHEVNVGFSFEDEMN